MSKTYYECHVTMLCHGGDPNSPNSKESAKAVVEGLGWKFSQIEGDIALGDGIKCYATMHYNSRTPQEDVLHLLNSTADNIAFRDIKVIRRKVELVIYDDRSTKIQPGTCEGACVGCHLDDYEEAQGRKGSKLLEVGYLTPSNASAIRSGLQGIMTISANQNAHYSEPVFLLK